MFFLKTSGGVWDTSGDVPLPPGLQREEQSSQRRCLGCSQRAPVPVEPLGRVHPLQPPTTGTNNGMGLEGFGFTDMLSVFLGLGEVQEGAVTEWGESQHPSLSLMGWRAGIPQSSLCFHSSVSEPGLIKAARIWPWFQNPFVRGICFPAQRCRERCACC